MTEEINIAGVLVPTFALCCVAALGLIALLRMGIGRIGLSDLHRFVWHPPLFDLSVFIIFLGALYALLHLLLL